MQLKGWITRFSTALSAFYISKANYQFLLNLYKKLTIDSNRQIYLQLDNKNLFTD